MIQIDMEVPTSCYSCPCFKMVDSRAFCLAKKNVRGTVFEMNPHMVHGKRNDWCPIIEKKNRDWWDILIEKFIPVVVAICFTMIIALLVKLLIA